MTRLMLRMTSMLPAPMLVLTLALKLTLGLTLKPTPTLMTRKEAIR